MKLDLTLPLHPTLRHPLTGEPLRAVYIDKRGRARYPMIGAAEDGGSGDGDDGGTGGTGGAGDQGGGSSGDSGGTDLGFPKDTPVAEMSTEQQVAYYKHQSRKHETRASEYRTAAGGKTAAEVQADLEAAANLRREQQTEQERAVEDAAKKAREEAAASYGPKAARAVFELALKHVEDKSERDEILAAIDVKSVLNDAGDIDTDKVSRIVARLAPQPAREGERRVRDFGAGPRHTDKTSGVAAGRDLFKERRGSKSTTTTTSS